LPFWFAADDFAAVGDIAPTLEALMPPIKGAIIT
jgi:hypothetical protein